MGVIPPVTVRPPQNILLIAEGQVGDLLLLTPAIRGLKHAFPRSELTVLIVDRRGFEGGEGELITRPTNRVLSRNPAINQLFSVRRDLLTGARGTRRLKAELAVIAFVRKQRFDTVISAFPHDRFALWSLFSGARRRIGEGRGLFKWVYTDTPVMRKGTASVVMYYAAIARLLGGEVPEMPTEFFPSDEGEAWAERFLSDRRMEPKTFVALHPGATGAYKIWPPERIADLADRLIQQTKLSILICGGPDDRSLVEEISGRVRTVNSFTMIESGIDRFASVVKRSALLISNDSGPRHVAVAVGTPSLCFFRQYHDREWGVYPASETVRILQGSEPCGLCPAGVCLDRIPDGEEYGSACLRGINVDQALRETLRILACGSSPATSSE